MVGALTESPGAATPGFEAPTAPVCAELPANGGASPFFSADPYALEIPDTAEIYVLNSAHYRAKMFIPCTYGSCPGRMQLYVADKRNRTLPRPFYLCDQDGGEKARWECPQSSEPVYPEEIRTRYVTEAHRVKPGRKSNERIYADEMETML